MERHPDATRKPDCGIARPRKERLSDQYHPGGRGRPVPVIPLHNEAASLSRMHTRLGEVAAALRARYSLACEVVYVDDGSRDNSLAIARALPAGALDVQIVSLSRNFGKEAALLAGLDHARLGAVLFMDGDGQHPPELDRNPGRALARGRWLRQRLHRRRRNDRAPHPHHVAVELDLNQNPGGPGKRQRAMSAAPSPRPRRVASAASRINPHDNSASVSSTFNSVHTVRRSPIHNTHPHNNTTPTHVIGNYDLSTTTVASSHHKSS